MSSQPHRSVPGIEPETAAHVSATLQNRLVSLLDLQLTLKHIHWNVVGSSFLSVHEMLDEQVAPVRGMSDDLAERIATLGGVPDGTPGAIVRSRSWDDYPHGRATFLTHLHELDLVYDGVIADHRAAIADVGPKDPITEDLLIGQTAQLEMFQWFVRSFIERAGETDGPPAVSPATRAAEARDARRTKDAGRAPTDREAQAAEEAAEHIDLDEVEVPYREMTRTGATVEGEGHIV